MHAGGRRFDPAWLHHFCDGLLQTIWNFDRETIFFGFLLFNNLDKVFDVLSGSTFDASQCVDSIQVSHLHMSHDTVRLAQPNRNADEL